MKYKKKIHEIFKFYKLQILKLFGFGLVVFFVLGWAIFFSNGVKWEQEIIVSLVTSLLFFTLVELIPYFFQILQKKSWQKSISIEIESLLNFDYNMDNYIEVFMRKYDEIISHLVHYNLLYLKFGKNIISVETLLFKLKRIEEWISDSHIFPLLEHRRFQNDIKNKLQEEWNDFFKIEE